MSYWALFFLKLIQVNLTWNVGCFCFGEKVFFLNIYKSCVMTARWLCIICYMCLSVSLSHGSLTLVPRWLSMEGRLGLKTWHSLSNAFSKSRNAICISFWGTQPCIVMCCNVNWYFLMKLSQKSRAIELILFLWCFFGISESVATCSLRQQPSIVCLP